MRSKARLLITVVAYALIGAHHVLADAIRAYTAGSRALVDVLAGLLVGSQLVSWRTLTVEAPFGVDTSATATQSWCFFALVYVWNVSKYIPKLFLNSTNFILNFLITLIRFKLKNF